MSRVTRYNTLNNTFYQLGAGSFGVDSTVNALAVIGTDLYIGGYFTTANNASALTVNGVTRYNTLNNTFYQLGAGSFGVNNFGMVYALAVIGTDLYIGGWFTQANNASALTVKYITRYNTTNNTFYALGAGSFGVSSWEIERAHV